MFGAYLGAQRVPGGGHLLRTPGLQGDECLPQEHLPPQAARVPHRGPQGAGRQQVALYLILGDTATMEGVGDVSVCPYIDYE